MNDWKTKEKALLRGARMSAGGNTERHQRGAERKSSERRCREIRWEGCSRRERTFAVTVADEMILPGDEFAGSIESAFKIMETAGAVVIVMEIVFAGPEELDGNAGYFGDPAASIM